VVVDANMVSGVATAIPDHECAAVGTTVNESVERAIFSAINHNRRIAGIGGFVVARVGDFRFQAQEQPNRAVEKLRLFLLVNLGIEEHRIRNPA